jgi:hypothetical protein
MCLLVDAVTAAITGDSGRARLTLLERCNSNAGARVAPGKAEGDGARLWPALIRGAGEGAMEGGTDPASLNIDMLGTLVVFCMAATPGEAYELTINLLPISLRRSSAALSWPCKSCARARLASATMLEERITEL